MRSIVLLALFATVVVAFNIFRDSTDEQLLAVRKARDLDSSSSSEESDKPKNAEPKETDEDEEGSGSGEEIKRRVAREASGDSSSEEMNAEASGIEVTSAPLRFVRSAGDSSSSEEGSGSGSGSDE